MIEFRVAKKSKKSRARLGFLKTSQGVVETPAFVPVATQAVVKTLTSEEVEKTKTQILIANTFHLHLKPGPARIGYPPQLQRCGRVAGGEKIVKSAGGLHKFMNWQRPLMTDSGGFQVFSLGFGKDLDIGKILKEKKETVIERGNQPQNLKITNDGVYFRSPLNGDQLFLGPKESIKIQEDLGADIIFTFDECAPSVADYGYTKKSLEKTHKWAEICLKTKKSKLALPNFVSQNLGGQALFGIVQGGRFKDLRKESAQFIGRLDFDGFGIGGEFGGDKRKMSDTLNWVVEELPESKPRHLLGIGYLEDIETIVRAGIDLFDCTVPTHYGRRGIAFTGKGKLNLNQPKFLKSREPIDKNCQCFVCQNYKRNYICHLLRAREMTALKLLTFHNLYYFNTLIEDFRNKIKNGKI